MVAVESAAISETSRVDVAMSVEPLPHATVITTVKLAANPATLLCSLNIRPRVSAVPENFRIGSWIGDTQH